MKRTYQASKQVKQRKQEFQKFESRKYKSEQSSEDKRQKSIKSGQSLTKPKHKQIKTNQNKLLVNNLIYHLFGLVKIILNLNYAIQNALITMLMVTFKTPAIVDSFIWITPNIISILLRPYVIRYAHKIKYTIVNQSYIVLFCLLLASIGAFIIAQSSLMKSKGSFNIIRIFLCSIGWTIAGVSFQLCDFFLQKLNKHVPQQCIIKNDVKLKTNNQNSDTKSTSVYNHWISKISKHFNGNPDLTGSLIGYLLVLVVFILPKIESIVFTSTNHFSTSQFFNQAYLCYILCSFVTFFSTISSFVIIYLSGLFALDPEQPLERKVKVFKISYSPYYYLNGLAELRSIKINGLLALSIHFFVNFINDVVFIYTTIWISCSTSTQDMKTGQANLYGILYGTLYLIGFVLFQNLQAPTKLIHLKFQNICLIAAIFSFMCFIFNLNIIYFMFIATVSLMSKNYKEKIQQQLISIDPLIEQCKQLVQRVEKVLVLVILPFSSMILLGRDDIVDSLFVCTTLLIALWFILRNISNNFSIQQVKSTKLQ